MAIGMCRFERPRSPHPIPTNQALLFYPLKTRNKSTTTITSQINNNKTIKTVPLTWPYFARHKGAVTHLTNASPFVWRVTRLEKLEDSSFVKMVSTQKLSNQSIESNHPNLTLTNGPLVLCNITNPQAQINTVTPSINSNTTHEDNQTSNPPFPTIQVVCGNKHG